MKARSADEGMVNVSKKPLISIITVVYNGVDGIEATLRSIFSQDPSLYEVAVIDGGSTDGRTGKRLGNRLE